MEASVERPEPFGVWLRGRRKNVLGLTQAQLAYRASCSETMIRKIEQGSRRPARDLAKRLLIVLGTPTGDLAADVAWARGLSRGSGAAIDRDIELNSTVNGSQTVLVPLDAIASFGTEQPTVIQLSEPYMGRLHWAPVPLAAVALFGMTPPCSGNGCNGQDPEISGCAKVSVTVDGRDIPEPKSDAVVGMVELRYSQACQTNWVRITRLCREERWLRAYLRNDTGDIIPETTVEVEASAVYGYGSMWYAPTGQIRVQACGLIEGCDEVCTSLH
jgi:transcriptional regulator with XRE-family HTH domain